MSHISVPGPPPDPTSAEPALKIGLVTAAAGAVLTLLVAFGVHLSQAQSEAIMGAIVTISPIVCALLIRRKVYAPATVARMLDMAGDRS